MFTQKSKYVVTWIYNGKSNSEEFDFLTIALIRMYQLEDDGMEPSLHIKS